MTAPQDPRAEVLAALDTLAPEDLRVLAWVVRQLPFRKLAAELHAEVQRSRKKNDPTTRTEFARSRLLGLVRDVAVVVGVYVPSGAELLGEPTGPSPTPPEQSQAIEVR